MTWELACKGSSAGERGQPVLVVRLHPNTRSHSMRLEMAGWGAFITALIDATKSSPRTDYVTQIGGAYCATNKGSPVIPLPMSSRPPSS
jgi:hypothetical protein